MRLNARISPRRRVKRGARWLDKRLPGWFNGRSEHLIDLDTLDLAQCQVCVLGQLEEPLLTALDLAPGEGEEGYTRVVNALYPPAKDVISVTPDGARFTVLHGFEVDSEAYHTLTRLWTQEIRRRRER